MKTDLFDYPLPECLIAQRPAARRDESRLLVVHRAEHRIEHRHFRDLPEYLRAGDTLFRNNAAVIPARLHATRPTGGQVECLLLRPAWTEQRSSDASGWNAASGRVSSSATQTNPSGLSVVALAKSEGRVPPSNPNAEEWWCLLRPGKKLPVDATFGITGLFTGTVREKTEDGTVLVSFETTGGDILAIANQIGEMPLPPYIAERHDNTERIQDRERYQTVYADRGHQVAAAAPTAGLHFTPELLANLATRGVSFADLTLHVGLGTFRPIMTDNIEDHAIHREVYEIPVSTQRTLFAPTGRRIAVGTTSVRTIEDYLSKIASTDCHREAGEANRGDPALRQALGLEHVETAGLLRRSAPRNDNPRSNFVGEAGIFIYPPRTFAGIDALITNFHQPRSTLLCLVSAFLNPGSTDGIAWLKEIYAEAVAREYRFFSYGDAMLIL